MRREGRQRAPIAILKPLGRIVTHAPRATFAVSDRLAPLLFGGLEARQLARIFPELSDNEARHVDRWSRRQLMRNRLLTEAIRLYGYDKRIGALGLPQPLLAAIKPPAIITGFHVGVLPLLGFALEQLQAKVLVIRRHPGGVANASFERAWTQGDDQHRALLFKRCRDFLHSGGFVYMAADPEPAGRGSLQAPFRQGSIQLARGPFALSRITGAPIIPLVSRWRRASVEFILGDPVQGCGEAELAAAVTAWLDRYLTADPMEISWQTLSLMI